LTRLRAQVAGSAQHDFRVHAQYARARAGARRALLAVKGAAWDWLETGGADNPANKAEAGADNGSKGAGAAEGAHAVRAALGELAGASPPPPTPPRTKWTRRVPHSVLIGHAASLTPY
jgi:hypothetical protein